MSGRILYFKNSSSKVNLNTYNVQAVGLGRAFCELGFDYDFIYFSNEEKIVKEEIINNQKLRIISKKGLRVLRSYICKEVLNKDFLESYDFVISTEYGQIMTYFLSKKSKNVSMYSGPYYNLFKLPFTSIMYDKLFNKSINGCCIAKFVKSELAKSFLEDKGYTNLVNVGVGLDTSRFDASVQINTDTKKICDIMKKNKCILYVGALSNRKNFPFIIKVYEEVLKKNKDIKLILIGKGKKQYVKKIMDNTPDNVKEGIIRVESIDNTQLKYVYPLANAFLLPSKLEIFGMVLLEAMYLGAPIVTSWNGGSSTLIYGKNTGQIIKEFEVDKWSEAVIKYIEDEAYTSIVTSEAQRLVKEKYNWLSIANNMINVINNAKDNM